MLTRTRLVMSDHVSAYWVSARTLKAAARPAATGRIAADSVAIDRDARSLSRETSEIDLLLDLDARSSWLDAFSAPFGLLLRRSSEDDARSMPSSQSTRNPLAAASSMPYFSFFG